jgi:uncharacterized membrane protein
LDAGLRNQIGEVGLVVVTPKCAHDLSRAGDAPDVACDAAITVIVSDVKIGGATAVLLVPHWAVATLIGNFLKVRDAFVEEGEGLLIGDVASGTIVQDLLGVLIDGVGAVVGAVAVGHGGL